MLRANAIKYATAFTTPSSLRGLALSAELSDHSRSSAKRTRHKCKSQRSEVYHLPGIPYYDQTKPEEIFCSEARLRQQDIGERLSGNRVCFGGGAEQASRTHSARQSISDSKLPISPQRSSILR